MPAAAWSLGMLTGKHSALHLQATSDIAGDKEANLAA